MERVITEMETEGALKNSKSPYNSSLLILLMKLNPIGNRKWRIVIGFRLLNKKTTGDAYPLPKISEIFNHLGRAQYYSVFDLASGFPQIE